MISPIGKLADGGMRVAKHYKHPSLRTQMAPRQPRSKAASRCPPPVDCHCFTTPIPANLRYAPKLHIHLTRSLQKPAPSPSFLSSNQTAHQLASRSAHHAVIISMAVVRCA